MIEELQDKESVVAPCSKSTSSTQSSSTSTLTDGDSGPFSLDATKISNRSESDNEDQDQLLYSNNNANNNNNDQNDDRSRLELIRGPPCEKAAEKNLIIMIEEASHNQNGIDNDQHHHSRRHLHGCDSPKLGSDGDSEHSSSSITIDLNDNHNHDEDQQPSPPISGSESSGNRESYKAASTSTSGQTTATGTSATSDSLEEFIKCENLIMLADGHGTPPPSPVTPDHRFDEASSSPEKSQLRNNQQQINTVQDLIELSDAIQQQDAKRDAETHAESTHSKPKSNREKKSVSFSDHTPQIIEQVIAEDVEVELSDVENENQEIGADFDDANEEARGPDVSESVEDATKDATNDSVGAKIEAQKPDDHPDSSSSDSQPVESVSEKLQEMPVHEKLPMSEKLQESSDSLPVIKPLISARGPVKGTGIFRSLKASLSNLDTNEVNSTPKRPSCFPRNSQVQAAIRTFNSQALNGPAPDIKPIRATPSPAPRSPSESPKQKLVKSPEVIEAREEEIETPQTVIAPSPMPSENSTITCASEVSGQVEKEDVIITCEDTGLERFNLRRETHNRAGTMQRLLATSRVQQEIQEQIERERSLKAAGVIQTLSTETTDELLADNHITNNYVKKISMIHERAQEEEGRDGASYIASSQSSDETASLNSWSSETNLKGASTCSTSSAATNPLTLRSSSSPWSQRFASGHRVLSPQSSISSGGTTISGSAGSTGSAPGKISMLSFIKSKGNVAVFNGIRATSAAPGTTNGGGKPLPMNSEPASPIEFRPAQFNKGQLNQIKRYIPADKKIKEEIEAQRQREEELRLQRERLGLPQAPAQE